jgi:hypothetical protein
MSKKLEGTLHISAPMGGSIPKEGRIDLSIEDEASGTLFLEAELTPQDLAMALVGSHSVPVQFELRPNRVGYKLEYEQREIFFEDQDIGQRREQAEVLLSTMTSDGWKGELADLLNSHRIIRQPAPANKRKGNWYRVRFFRWVDANGRPYETVTEHIRDAAPELLQVLQDLLAVVNVRIDDPRTKQFDAARDLIKRLTDQV